MTRRKCKCPEGSPFHWRDEIRKSVLLDDKSTVLSMNQTLVIEREREKGRDISHFPGMSDKSAKLARTISVREFNIFSRAGQKL